MKDTSIYQQNASQVRVQQREALQTQIVQEMESFFQDSGLDSADLEDLMAELDEIERLRESK